MKRNVSRRALSAVLAASIAVGLNLYGTVTPAAKSDKPKKSVINGAQLNPRSTGSDKYDERIAAIAGEGSTYDRVRSCYTWLAANMDYLDDAPRDKTGDKYLNVAHGPLFHGQGSCKNYAAATYLMLRYIGLPDVEMVDGTIINSDGSRQYHIWNVVTLDGVRYIVDAEVDGKVYNRKGDRIRYLYFFANPATYHENPKYLEGVHSYAGKRETIWWEVWL